MNEQRLILFAKAPVAGRVKTRLVPPLTYERAAELYRGWARGIFSAVRRLNVAEVWVSYDGQPEFPDPSWMDPEGPPVAFFAQAEGDLGRRMGAAFESAFREGARRVVLIGTDSPGLPPAYLAEAFASLRDHDLVLGPALDGGYYSIGLSDRLPPGLFEGVAWSTPRAREQTEAAARNLGLRLHRLPEYFDVDEAADLARIGVAF